MYFHLIVTDDCNLCCSYCRAKAFDGGNDGCSALGDIDEDLPVDVDYDIAELGRFLSRDPDPVVTFYGGEPLLKQEVIRAIMDLIPRPRYMIQTNGLLLHELPQEYVNRFETILVSLDGRERITDAHRGAGTYRKVMENVKRITKGGFRGELIARMTVAEDTDIVDSVLFLAENPDCSFSSIHWQLDANFTSDFSNRSFASWVRDSYNPGIRALVQNWISRMEKTGSVPRWYPFLDTMDDLLHERETRLRCGAGYTNYSIMTNGYIAPCPVMAGMRQYYLGHISTADPSDLRKIDVGGECTSCDIRSFCGGRCLYAGIVSPWGGQGRQLVCGTVRNLHDTLCSTRPAVQALLASGRVNPSQFTHEKFNGCEIIP